MGIRKKALLAVSGVSEASNFHTHDYNGGQTFPTVRLDEIPLTRNVVVDVAPWLFTAHLDFCFEPAAVGSPRRLKRAVLVPEVLAAMLVCRASFLLLPRELLNLVAGRATGDSRVALCFDNNASVPGSGRKWLEHIHRDLHDTQPAASPEEVANPPPPGSGRPSTASGSGDASADDGAGDDADNDAGPRDTSSPIDSADHATINWQAYSRQYTTNVANIAAPYIVEPPAWIPPETKRGQRYRFYTSIRTVLESGQVPPLCGSLYIDDGRDEFYRELCGKRDRASADMQHDAYVYARRIPATASSGPRARIMCHCPDSGVLSLRLNCYGIARALQLQREALISALEQLILRGLATEDGAVDVMRANLHSTALMFKAAIGQEACAAFAEIAIQGGFAWTTSGSGDWASCTPHPREAPRCAEGERLALVYIRTWMAEQTGGRTVFMCEDSDGPALALQLFAPQICNQNALVCHPVDPLQLLTPDTHLLSQQQQLVRSPDTPAVLAIMRYKRGCFEELDYALMAERIAMQIITALESGLARYQQRRRCGQPIGAKDALAQGIRTRAAQLVALVAAMLFFVGSDYVQDMNRLVPDFPLSIDPTRLMRAILRTIFMVAECEGPDVLRSNHALYCSPAGEPRATLPGVQSDGTRGLNPAVCALIVAVLIAEYQAHGLKYRCGEGPDGGTLPHKPSKTGRRRKRPYRLPPGSLGLCRSEMRMVRRFLPLLLACDSQPAPPTDVTAHALVYACPYRYQLAPVAVAGAEPEVAAVSGKRKRASGDGEPPAKRPKRGPRQMVASQISMRKLVLYRKLAVAIGNVPGCDDMVRRFAAAGFRTGKRPTKQRLANLNIRDRITFANVLRGQIARLVCDDWTLHAYMEQKRVLDCTACLPNGDSIYGFRKLDSAGQAECMGLAWPRQLLLDDDGLACVQACLRGYRDTGY